MDVARGVGGGCGGAGGVEEDGRGGRGERGEGRRGLADGPGGDEKGDGEERPVCVEPRQGRQSRQVERVVVLNVDVEL